MFITVKSIIRVAAAIAVSLWALFIAAIVAPFLQEIAKEQGVFEAPTARASIMIDALAAFIRAPVAAWVVGGIVGVATGFLIGAWVASRLDKSERDRMPTRGPLRDYSKSTPLTTIVLDFSSLGKPSPWLIFYCEAFNGSGMNLTLWEACGRVRIDSEEFHGKLELPGPVLQFNGDLFFKFCIRVPLGDKEESYLQTKLAGDGIAVEFLNATIRTTINDLESHTISINSMIRLPPVVLFNTKTGISDPSFISQVGSFAAVTTLNRG